MLPSPQRYLKAHSMPERLSSKFNLEFFLFSSVQFSVELVQPLLQFIVPFSAEATTHSTK
jgi:hypothetical protein